jgi:hypothetical protein
MGYDIFMAWNIYIQFLALMQTHYVNIKIHMALGHKTPDARRYAP